MQVKPGIYLHYKGGYYRVVGVGRHSETLEEMVIYQHVDNDSWWVRPVKMFAESVVKNGVKIPRFKYVAKE